MAACVAVATAASLNPSPPGHPRPAHSASVPGYALASTVLTLEGGLVGTQHLFHFTPLQLQGALCRPPNQCRPVDYPAWPGEQFNAEGADLLAQAMNAPPADPGPIVVYGHSQGGQVIYNVLRRWAANPQTAPDPSRVSWVSIGNPENPYGGFAANRGPEPALPADTAYHGIEVIRQYDGWADWPDDQKNLLAVANALVGMTTVHSWYFNVDLNDPRNVHHTPAKPDGSPGNVEYVWVPNPVLPLIAGTGPLAPVLDKLLRPIIEAGYQRPVTLPGSVPPPAQSVEPAHTAPAAAAITVNANRDVVKRRVPAALSRSVKGERGQHTPGASRSHGGKASVIARKNASVSPSRLAAPSSDQS